MGGLIFEKLGTAFATSTAHHPQTDGQPETTDRTVEIGLHFQLTTNTDDWVIVLQFLQGSLNNSMGFSTGFAPNELACGFRVRDSLGLLADLPREDLDQLRPIKREEADDVIAFVDAVAKPRYDSNHKAIRLQPMNDLMHAVLQRNSSLFERCSPDGAVRLYSTIVWLRK